MRTHLISFKWDHGPEPLSHLSDVLLRIARLQERTAMASLIGWFKGRSRPLACRSSLLGRPRRSIFRHPPKTRPSARACRNPVPSWHIKNGRTGWREGS
jgi:hypothetical protein